MTATKSAPKSANAFTFAEARLRGTKYLPYLTQHTMSLIPVPTPGIETMGVDQFGRCYYDPAVLSEWSLDKCAGVVLHEDLHLVLRHHARARAMLGETIGEEERKRWNIAADMCVNQILRGAGVPLPDDVVFPEQFKFPMNLSMEEYYGLLDADAMQKSKKPAQPGGSAADGQKQPWEKGQADSDSTRKDQNKEKGGNGEGEDDGDGEDGDGQGGNGSGNNPGDGHSDAPAGLSEHELQMLERKVAHAYDEWKQSSSRGTQSGYMQRFADEILRPKTDPVRELLAQVKYAINAISGHGNYTWKKPPRRSPPGSIRLPAHVQPIPRVTVICDTSGSMNEKDLSLSLGVIAQVVKALPSQGVKVLCGDTSVKSAKKCFRAEQVEMCGGGGTDMAELITAASLENPRPDVIVVCTDGETPWPDNPVGPRVVACVTRESKYFVIPDWIQKVEIRA